MEESAILELLKPFEERVSSLENKLKEKDDEIVVLRGAVANLTRQLAQISTSPKVESTPLKSQRPSISGASGSAFSTAGSSKKILTPSVSNSEPKSTPTTPTNGSGSALDSARPKTANPATKKPAVPATTAAKTTARPTSAVAKTPRGPAASAPAEEEKSTPTKAEGGIRAMFGRKFNIVFPPTDFEAAGDAGAEPSQKLELEHVHGYNGRGRHNLHLTDANTAVYSIAGLGVVLDLPSRTQKFFNGHNEDVMCLTVNRAKQVAASGQIDPKGDETPYVCVWGVADAKEQARLYFHDKGVLAVAFSADGSTLISIGEDTSHTMAIWQWEKAIGKEASANSKERPSPIAPLASQSAEKERVLGVEVDPFSPEGKLRFATFGLRHIKVWTFSFDTNTLECSKGVFGALEAPKAVVCAAFTSSGQVLAGADNGHVYVFNGKEASSKFKAHEGSVGVVRLVMEGEEERFYTCGFDGNVAVWSKDFTNVTTYPIAADAKARGLDVFGETVAVGTLGNEIYTFNTQTREPQMIISGHAGEVWGLACHASLPLVASAAEDKTLRVWDITTKTQVPGKCLPLEKMARSVDWSLDGRFIAVGLKSGQLIVVDYESFAVVKTIFDANEMVDSVKFSPDCRWLAAGSWDQHVYIYDCSNDFTKTRALTGNTASVIHLNFSADSKYIVSNSSDCQILFWEVATGKRVNKPSQLRDTQWAQWTCVLGWPVMGMWDPSYDQTDINACCQARNLPLLALGDDLGKVKLLKYPSVSEGAASRAFTGHSAHVTNVRFSFDDNYLFSTGGNDTALFQWRVISA